MTKAQRMTRLLTLLKHHGIAWPLAAEDTRISRIYAGHWQRSAGAWSWQLWPTREAQLRGCPPWHNVGSQFTVTELLKAGPTQTDIYITPTGEQELCVKFKGGTNSTPTPDGS